MTKEHKEKLKEGREERSESRTMITFENVTIKSYEHGWMLLIKGDSTRYYSDLSGLFKKLFSIKLSRKRMDTLQAIELRQNDCLREVNAIATRLEMAILTKES